MVRRILQVGICAAMTLPAAAQSCDGLGLPNPYLTQHFCKALKEVSNSNQPTRGLGQTDAPLTAPALPEWPDAAVLQDAYRADPRKTLELIRRIKDAGGLGSN